MAIVTLQLDLTDIDMIQSGLSMYIDYLRDGDEDDKELAKRAEETYDKTKLQIKWS